MRPFPPSGPIAARSVVVSLPENVASARRFSVETGMFEQEESGEVEQQLLAVIRGKDPAQS